MPVSAHTQGRSFARVLLGCGCPVAPALQPAGRGPPTAGRARGCDDMPCRASAWTPARLRRATPCGLEGGSGILLSKLAPRRTCLACLFASNAGLYQYPQQVAKRRQALQAPTGLQRQWHRCCPRRGAFSQLPCRRARGAPTALLPCSALGPSATARALGSSPTQIGTTAVAAGVIGWSPKRTNTALARLHALRGSGD